MLAVPTGWVQVTDERSIVPAGAGVGAAGAPGPDAPPFVGGWIGWLGYDLGRRLEPTGQGVRARAASDRDWPLGLWLRCPGAMVHDAWTGRWQAVGEASSSASALAACVASARAARAPGRVEPFRLETPADPHPRERYEAGVREALARIGAGEVFQVNLARRLSAPFTGDTRALFAALCARARPRFGCYAESVTTGAPGPAHAVLSLSPELFLEGDLRTGEVATRPMKGTRPITGDARELFEAGKDRAELAMIVDLMRNDLGRVARFGSVRVAEARSIERHAGGGVLQAVAEVRARLREGVTLDELLRATFPPGSVTGAPKIRAMRLIDELEASRRGPYCGASGFISDHGRFAFNVAIRTAGVLGERGRDGRFRRATLDYSVGAGIVADSVPGDEYDETAQKAWAIRSAGGARPGRALGGAGA
ncbi:MAG: anthranilate synthase component I family protein [Phycisphaerales bacterium]|nr:MAG: anthranilate synthase component I family protein [Phycisphaerales bacterium]